jgi:hypothetical protein
LSADTDADGFDDGTEVALGSDPNSAESVPAAQIPTLTAAGLAGLAALLIGAGVTALHRRVHRG